MNWRYVFNRLLRFETVTGAAFDADVIMSITPAAVNTSAVTAAWTRNVLIRVTDTAGNVHTWLNETYAATLSIADTSVAGTASIVSTNLVFRNGTAVITITGSNNAWLAGETDTLTVANINVTVAGAVYLVIGGTSVETFV